MQDQLTLEMERWEPVVGYEGRYEVSDQGRVRSRYRVVGQGDRAVRVAGKMMNPSNGNGRYRYVGLYRAGRPSTKRVHRLVLEAFVGPCPPRQECRHLNGNPADNRLSNLKWDTVSANQMDRVKHGTSNRGKRNGQSVLTEADVRVIRDRPRTDQERIKLGRKFGVSKYTIRAIQQRQRWAWLP